MAKKSSSDDSKVFALLSYLGILVLIPLIMKKDDAFVKFHAKQGLVLFIFELVLYVLAVIPVIGWILAPIGWVIALILSIMGIIYSLQGKKWVMPVLGKYADKFSL